MTINTDAVLAFAALIFIVCVVAYIILLVMARRIDRDVRRDQAQFERDLSALLRR